MASNQNNFFWDLELPNQQEIASPSIEESVVKNAIKHSTGRIITVERVAGMIAALSTCSATLVEPEIILTASHCLELNEVMLLRDRITNIITKLMLDYESEKYFDIPGLTSNISSQDLASISTAVIGTEVSRRLEAYLSQLPKIEHYTISPYTEQNPFKSYNNYIPRTEAHLIAQSAMIAENLKSTKAVENDFGYARLSKRIPKSKPLKISAYTNHQSVFIAGFDGSALGSPLKVQVCKAHTAAMEIIFENLINTLMLLQFSKINGPQEPRQIERLDKAIKNIITWQGLIEDYSKVSILNVCKTAIVGGNSGGPQLVLQDGSVSFVGINSSQVLKTNYIIGVKAVDAERSGIIDKLK